MWAPKSRKERWRIATSNGDSYLALRDGNAPLVLTRSVRCKRCGRGIGKYCRQDNGKPLSLEHAQRRSDVVRLARYIDILWGSG